eukprot:Skav234753  [mRNA]  locus=scaffold14:894654:903966:- [translate_table: standard]
MHYYNPSLDTGVQDSSGVRVTFASTLRTYDAGTFRFNGGTGDDQRDPIPPGQSHYTLQKSPDGEHVGDLRREKRYDFNHQSLEPASVSKLKKGDELILSCTYDTSSRTAATTFGDFTHAEGGFCSEDFQLRPFHARVLLQTLAGKGFEFSSKPLRHLFAKDMLLLLKRGDCADRLYCCKALQRCRPGGLGRFQGAIVRHLLKVAKSRVGANFPVDPQARTEAIKALATVLPHAAAKRYPDIRRHLISLQSDLPLPPDDLRQRADQLIVQLDADVVAKFETQIEPAAMETGLKGTWGTWELLKDRWNHWEELPGLSNLLSWFDFQITCGAALPS